MEWNGIDWIGLDWIGRKNPLISVAISFSLNEHDDKRNAARYIETDEI